MWCFFGRKNIWYKEKNYRGKDREGSFQIKQHPTGFIGSADDIIFSTEPGVQNSSQVFVVETFADVWAWGKLLEGRVPNWLPVVMFTLIKSSNST